MATPPFDPIASSATITTAERSIVDDTTVGVPLSKTAKFWGYVALNCAANLFGDEFQLKFYSKISGGTQIAVETIPIVGTVPGWLFVGPVFLYDDYDITLKKIAGTDRSIRWALYRIIGDTNLVQWLGSAPNALIAGRPDVNLGASQANSIAVGAFTANSITASAAATDLITEIWDHAYEGAETVRTFLRLVRSVQVGKASGLLTNFTSRDAADTKSRVLHTMGGGGDTRTPTVDGT